MHFTQSTRKKNAQRTQMNASSFANFAASLCGKSLQPLREMHFESAEETHLNIPGNALNLTGNTLP
jgi:hypothetical protein